MNDCGVTDLGLIDAVRHFNRFYTRQLGLLEEGLLQSGFSLTEARILYELAHRDEATATEMCSELVSTRAISAAS
jgi:DNA-binding MarR family transcriptional regulator